MIEEENKPDESDPVMNAMFGAVANNATTTETEEETE